MFWYGDHLQLWQAALAAAGLAAFLGLLVWTACSLIVNVTRWPAHPRGEHDIPRMLELRPARIEARVETSRRPVEFTDADGPFPMHSGGPR